MYCTWPGSTRMETNMHTYMYHISQSGKEGWWGAWDLLVPCALPRPRRLPCAWPPPLLPVCVIAMFKPFLTSSYGLLCLRMLTHAHVHGDDLLCECEAFVLVPNLFIDLFLLVCTCICIKLHVCVWVLHLYVSSHTYRAIRGGSRPLAANARHEMTHAHKKNMVQTWRGKHVQQNVWRYK